MQVIDPIFDELTIDRERDPRRSLLWLFPWCVALGFGAGMEGWVLHAHRAAAPKIVMARPAAAAAPVAEKTAANPYGGLVDFFADARPAAPAPASPAPAKFAAAQPAPAAAEKLVNPYGGLVDFFADSRPAAPRPDRAAQASLDAAPPAPVAATPQPQDIPLPPKREVASIDDEAPLPPARPAEFASLEAPTTPPADDGNIFQKLFGSAHPSSPALGYAAPEGPVAGNSKVAAIAATDRASGFSLFGRSATPTGYDKLTAVYDISARTVYLPDGTRLEAHSGLGDLLDDPRYVSEHGRGATPPHLYELEPREALFHGVQALRLTPVGDGDIYGRAGLLAHPYMLGPNGDSNGCVSFKDYDAFLRAYQQGQIKRLAVVAKLD
ncbi:MAG: DUF2778 domain-containing protein [Roseiarcus sp.]